MSEVAAILRGAQISAQKVRLVADQIRGKHVAEALTIINDKNRVRPKISEVERLFCDNKKLLSNTNWSPKYNMQKGLSETLEWFQNNLKLYKSELYNV